MVITKIIMTLPAEYKHFVSAWESTHKDSQTIEHLTNRLMIEESRVGANAPVEKAEAFFSRQRPNTGKRGMSKSKKPGKCFRCGGSGHWKSECKVKRDEKKNFGRKENQQKYDSDGENSKGFFSGSGCSPSDTWYVDSGATDHVCKHRQWFTRYT